MLEREVKVYVKEPGERIKKALVKGGIPTLRKVIGGVELLDLGEGRVLIYNRYAGAEGKSLTLVVLGKYIYGTVILCDGIGVELKSSSLTQEEASRFFAEHEGVLKNNIENYRKELCYGC